MEVSEATGSQRVVGVCGKMKLDFGRKGTGTTEVWVKPSKKRCTDPRINTFGDTKRETGWEGGLVEPHETPGKKILIRWKEAMGDQFHR